MPAGVRAQAGLNGSLDLVGRGIEHCRDWIGVLEGTAG